MQASQLALLAAMASVRFSFSADGNNFYLFVDEGQVRIVPWDCDVDLGVWYLPTALSVDPRQPWLTSPWR